MVLVPYFSIISRSETQYTPFDAILEEQVLSHPRMLNKKKIQWTRDGFCQALKRNGKKKNVRMHPPPVLFVLDLPPLLPLTTH